jgi:diguanylate cyclase (GGDEF)-like protein
MELRIYLSVLARRWWLILAVTVICGVAALLYALNQPEVYQGSASYVLRPHASLVFDDSTVRAIDTLSRRIEIATTYAEVAGSDLIQNRAIENLELDPDDSTGLSVTGRVIPGTNVLELSIRGPNREIIGLFADEVNLEFIAYVNSLYDVFELELLDQPRVARLPIGPDAKLIMAGGVVLGVALGSILALLVQYWQIVTADTERFDILDSETGTFNRTYFNLRLKEEVSRSARNRGTFALTLLAIEFPGVAETWTGQYKADMLRRVITFVGDQIREEDMLCRYEATKFALLLPELSIGQARDLLAGVEQRFGAGAAGQADEDYAELGISAGIACFTDQASADEIIQQAEQALETASRSEDIQIALFEGGREPVTAGA